MTTLRGRAIATVLSLLLATSSSIRAEDTQFSTEISEGVQKYADGCEFLQRGDVRSFVELVLKDYMDKMESYRQQQVDALEKATAEANSLKQLAEQNLAVITSEYRSLQNSKDKLQSEVASLTEAKLELQQEESDLKNSLRLLTDRIDSSKETRERLRSEQSMLQSNISQLNRHVEDAQGRLHSTKTELATAEHQLRLKQIAVSTALATNKQLNEVCLKTRHEAFGPSLEVAQAINNAVDGFENINSQVQVTKVVMYGGWIASAALLYIVMRLYPYYQTTMILSQGSKT